MKNIKKIIILSIVIFFSCERNNNNIHFAKTNYFINQVGTYYFNTNKIVVKKFDNGSLIYGVADNRNKILYQRSLFEAFSGYNKWGLFIDTKQNIWFYTLDYQEYSVLLKDSINNKYTYKKLDNNSIEIPNDFKLRLNR